MAVPPPSTLPRGDKAALRREVRRARRLHVAALVANGGYAAALGTAAETALAHIPAEGAVALYRMFGDELDPAALATLLAACGRRLALPHVEADGAAMRFLAWHPDAPLHEGAFALHQPHAESEPVRPQVIVTPLVAFDRTGGRLGQGAGYYDRAFAAFPDALRIGYAWSVQEVAAIPTDPWDVPLHAVATERGWIACEATL